MIRLAATNQSLEIILNAAVAANQLPVVACFSDYLATSTTRTYGPGGRQVTSSNNTTAATIVSAPAASTTRDVDFVSVHNADTAPADVTIRFNDNGTTYRIVRVTLAALENLVYSHARGWFALTAAGAMK